MTDEMIWSEIDRLTQGWEPHKTLERLHDFVTARVKEERERCAKIADGCHLEQQGLAPGDDCCGPRVAHDILSSK